MLWIAHKSYQAPFADKEWDTAGITNGWGGGGRIVKKMK